ncbi:thymidine kinase [bacterium 3DAC]|nr:thymidine kinase [Dictyoglomota bacterium]UZN23167.1 thymidine kinase [bacterium 3DAC]
MLMHLTVITGPMFAGKTTELIRRLKRYQYAGKKVILFKPTIDVRSPEGRVKSHDGKEMEAIEVSSSSEIAEYMEKVEDISAVGIDEVQFLDDDIVEVIKDLVFRGYDVFVSGLDMDFMGRPFGVMPYLLAIADDVYKLKAVCVVCGADATHSFKKKRDSLIIEVGGADIYEPRCLRCWYEGIKEQEGTQLLDES